MSDVFARFDDNDYRYWVTQQLQAGMDASAYKTFTHRDSQGVNSWLAARHARNELSGYTEDLAQAAHHARTAAPSAQALARCTGYALLEYSLRKLGSHIPAQLASALVKGGIWTTEQAFTWARLSDDGRQTLAIFEALIITSDDSFRERLLAEAALVSREIGDESGQFALARMAGRTTDPHVQALLLKTLLEEPEKGGRVYGLSQLVPQLDSSLVDLAWDYAMGLGNLYQSTTLLVAIANSRPLNRADASYHQLFDTVRAGVSDQEPFALQHLANDLDSVFDMLAVRLPRDRLPELREILNDMDPSSSAAATGMAALQGRDLEPEVALALAAECPDTWIGRQRHERFCCGAAGRYVEANDIDRALAALIRVQGSMSHLRYKALLAFAERVTELVDPRWPELLAALGMSDLLPLLREFARSPSPAVALLEVPLRLGGSARTHAMAALSPLLSPEGIDQTLNALLRNHEYDGELGLADLLPYLSVAKVKHVVHHAMTSAIHTRVRLNAIASVSDSLPVPDLALALRAALQPDSLTDEMVKVRVILAQALPAKRVTAVIEAATSLRRLEERVGALTQLAAQGHAQALSPLVRTIDQMSKEETKQKTGRKALRALISGVDCPGALPHLVDVAAHLPTTNQQALAYLVISTHDRSPAAALAAKRLLDLMSREADVFLPALDQPKDTTFLLAELCARSTELDEERFANIVLEIATTLTQDDCLVLSQWVNAMDVPRARLFAQSVLAGRSTKVAREVGLGGLAAAGPCPENFLHRLSWLSLLDSAQIAAPPGVVADTWGTALALIKDRWVRPLSLLASVTRKSVDPDTVARAIAVALRLSDYDFRTAVKDLAPFLSRDELGLLLTQLRLRADGHPQTEDFEASAACAKRSAELEELDLAAAFFTFSENIWEPAWRAIKGLTTNYEWSVCHALKRLPEAVLVRLTEGVSAQSEALCVLAVAAAEGHHEALARSLLHMVSDRSDSQRTEPMVSVLRQVASAAPESWESWFLPLLRHWNHVDSITVFALRLSPTRRHELVIEGLDTEADWTWPLITAAPEMLQILPPEQVQAAIWKEWTNGPQAPASILDHLHKWSGLLVAIFGPPAALALDETLSLTERLCL